LQPGWLDEHPEPSSQPPGHVTVPQPATQLTSHAHALPHSTVLHVFEAAHITLQLPLSPSPQVIERHALFAAHVISQLVPLQVIERHALSPVHAMMQLAPLAHVTLLQPLVDEHVSWQVTPLGHVKSPPGFVTVHTGGSCVVSHESHDDGHGSLPWTQ
jgi:hypothetical protein